MHVRDEVIVEKRNYIHHETNNSKLDSNCPPLPACGRQGGGGTECRRWIEF